jgi:glycosyltransferase 2 family protein
MMKNWNNKMPIKKADTEAQEAQEAMQSVRFSRVLFAILIGVGVVAYLIWKQFDLEEFKKIDWTLRTFGWLAVSIAILALRHFSYMARLHILTEGAFSWRKCFELIFIWEFSSAVTPTSVGGSAVALFVLSQEKLSTAKTATIVIYTVILDSVFFLVGIPLFFLFFGDTIIPSGVQFFGSLGATIVLALTYAIMLTYATLFAWGIFISPRRIKSLLLFFCKLPFLKRFTVQAEKLGSDILLTSKEVRSKSWQYHFGAFAATIGAWTCKFLLIIAIVIAVVPTFQTDLYLLVLTFAKLETMFLLILLFPSPGGAGFAEFAFGAFMNGYIPQTSALVIALIWRLLSYYSYLIAGAIIIPTWIKNRIAERKKRS